MELQFGHSVRSQASSQLKPLWGDECGVASRPGEVGRVSNQGGRGNVRVCHMEGLGEGRGGSGRAGQCGWISAWRRGLPR